MNELKEKEAVGASGLRLFLKAIADQQDQKNKMKLNELSVAGWAWLDQSNQSN